VYDLSKDSLPCGCSKSAKLSLEQWRVVLTRRASSIGAEYRGYDGEWNGQKTKINVYCPLHDLTWHPVAGSLLILKGCPKCAIKHRSKSRSIKEHVMIERFESLDVFAEGTKFEKQEGRRWKVICPLCPGREFFSDRSNLIAGKRPCNCGNGGGFDQKLPASVYVLLIGNQSGSLFVGYGISNFLDRRLVGHRRELAKKGFTILEEHSIDTTGEMALTIERDLKKLYPLNSQDVTGFIREATYDYCYERVVDYLYLAEDF